MATTAPQPRSSGGLSFMQPLSPRVRLFRPSPEKTKDEHREDDPALIIIFGWMNAGNGPLAKYIHQHQAPFPASASLLVRSSTRVVLEQDEVQAPSHSGTGARPRRPRLLLHAFSNAGSTMLYHLYTAYAETSSTGAA